MKNTLYMINSKLDIAERKINEFVEQHQKPSKMKHEKKKDRVSVSCETSQWPNIHSLQRRRKRWGTDKNIGRNN